MKKRSGSETVQVKLRMREDFRRKLERESEKRGLTTNAELLRRLELSFEETRPEDAVGGPLNWALLRALAAALDQNDLAQTHIDQTETTQRVTRALADLLTHRIQNIRKIELAFTNEKGSEGHSHSCWAKQKEYEDDTRSRISEETLAMRDISPRRWRDDK